MQQTPTTYIHQHTDWPRMYWDAGKLADRVASAQRALGTLSGRLQGLGFEAEAYAELEATVEETLSTSLIEGEVLSRVQVRSSVARRLHLPDAGYTPSTREVSESRDVRGIVEVMLDATHNFNDDLDEERLFRWHSQLFPDGWSAGRRIKVGGWSDEQMEVSQTFAGGLTILDFEAPAPDRTAREMAQFLAWFQRSRSRPDLLRAGQAHLWFETIHPFEDGNGRIGRAITELALAQAETRATRYYSLSTQLLRERDDYYRYLKEQQQSGSLDITSWLQWFVGVLERSVATSEQILESVLARAAYWQEFSRHNLNDRQRKVLSRFLDDFKGHLQVSKYAKLAHVSPDTALRDLTELVEFGILRREGAGRSTHYVLADRPLT